MANYNVDIAVAIKNARALKALNKDIKVTSNIIDDTNAKLRQNANAFEANFNRLNKSVREARKNLNEAAKNFYHFLHKLDQSKCKKIAVAEVPDKGLGKTINDRLKRAIK